jgi:hypothetical protein
MKPFKEYFSKDKLKELYHDYIRFEYCNHPESRLYTGMSIFSLAAGTMLLTGGYPYLAIVSYGFSAAGIVLMNKKLTEDELREEQRPYVEEVIEDLKTFDREYQADLEGKIKDK